jgi:hypothetical protein
MTRSSFPAFLRRSEAVPVDLTWIVIDHPQLLISTGVLSAQCTLRESREVCTNPRGILVFIGGLEMEAELGRVRTRRDKVRSAER